jgi:hypothetical protein
MLETCTSSDVLAGFLPFACSCAIVVLCTASVLAVDGSLLLACLLLLARLLACPSPPRLAPGSSPPGLVLSFNWPPWFCWMCLSDEVQELILFLVWVARTLVFLRWCSVGSVCGCFPLVLFTRSTASLASSCGAASTNFPCSD